MEILSTVMMVVVVAVLITGPFYDSINRATAFQPNNETVNLTAYGNTYTLAQSPVVDTPSLRNTTTVLAINNSWNWFPHNRTIRANNTSVALGGFEGAETFRLSTGYNTTYNHTDASYLGDSRVRNVVIPANTLGALVLIAAVALGVTLFFKPS